MPEAAPLMARSRPDVRWPPAQAVGFSSARRIRMTTECSSGMFTHLQLKPHSALALAFVAWSAWLREHARPHATLIRQFATGFVPIGFEVHYLQPADFFEADALRVDAEVATWNPSRFHSLQDVLVTLSSDPAAVPLARIYIQEVCVRIESQQTLAARSGRLPAELEADLLDDVGHQPRPLLLNRPMRAPPEADRIATHCHDFVVYRHACEAADQWYSEHVVDYIGAARESMVFALLEAHPSLLPGLAHRIERIRIGLRRPYTWFDRGQVATSAYRVGGELHFFHRLLDSNGRDAGDALEVFNAA